MTFDEITGVTTPVDEQVRSALAKRLHATGTTCDGKGYVDRPQDNVLCPDVWSSIELDLKDGAGDELSTSKNGPAKFRAAHSSSALAVNTFGPWRDDPSNLSIAGLSGFTSLRFEHACGAGVRGTAPHLDVLARTSDTVLAIESKCTEFLRPKIAEFAEAYANIEDLRRDSPWFRFVTDAHLRERFAHLDVGQLVKHFLGLANTFPNGRTVLLYLFWEPVNAVDFAVFRNHRRELQDFASMIAGDRVEFRHLSYPELWCEWDVERAPAPQRQHVEKLRARYLIHV